MHICLLQVPLLKISWLRKQEAWSLAKPLLTDQPESVTLPLFFLLCIMSGTEQGHLTWGPPGHAAHLNQPAQDVQQNKHLTNELTHRNWQTQPPV